MDLAEQCKNAIAKQVHPNVAFMINDAKPTDLDTMEDVVSFTNSINVTEGRFPKPCSSTLYSAVYIGGTTVLKPLTCDCASDQVHRMKQTQKPEGIAKITGIQKNSKGEDCFRIRMDDVNHLDFWLEFDIPLKGLLQVLNDKEEEEKENI